MRHAAAHGIHDKRQRQASGGWGGGQQRETGRGGHGQGRIAVSLTRNLSSVDMSWGTAAFFLSSFFLSSFLPFLSSFFLAGATAPPPAVAPLFLDAPDRALPGRPASPPCTSSTVSGFKRRFRGTTPLPHVSTTAGTGSSPADHEGSAAWSPSSCCRNSTLTSVSSVPMACCAANWYVSRRTRDRSCSWSKSSPRHRSIMSPASRRRKSSPSSGGRPAASSSSAGSGSAASSPSAALAVY